MCGRYKLEVPQVAFDYFDAPPPKTMAHRYNIKPTQRVYVSRHTGAVEEMVWGLKPKWGSPSQILINAKSETVRAKPTFKKSFAERRCLMVADGFYEWLPLDAKTRIPYLFTLKDNAPFAIAAFYDDADENRCCLLTTAANQILQPIHHRMPVIIRKEDWQEWLEHGDLPEATFTRITAPYNASAMSPAVELSRYINAVDSGDDARIIQPAPAMPTPPAPPTLEGELF